ncbi:hypothetical protein [Streptomyces erythrochromogenes]|uniref:hypothetical protein n=1 Tax=Streptomyces erythrochromogenes TaxID=285574 RepID=UPI00386B63D0|nr:hypothetical protein OG364_06220 [Streptomyces erythrochromogenes]
MTGDNWRWARTALQLAGFEKDNDGNYVTPLTDITRARQSLAALGGTALAHGALVTADGNRYIGDFAHELGEALPGQWSVRVENYSVPIWQEDLLHCLWASRTDPLVHSVKTDRLLAAAILRGEGGVELAVVPVPGHDAYRVGALTPADMNLTPEVAAPSSITVRDAHAHTAHQVSSSLLADYRQAVWRMQLIALRDDLDWAHEAYEPGMVTDPPQHDLSDAFARFADAAPRIISTVRASAHLNTYEQAFLDDMDAVFGQPSLPQKAATAPHNATIPDPLAVWLLDGQDLVDLARSVTRPYGPGTVLPPVRTAPALPAPPPLAAPLTRR